MGKYNVFQNNLFENNQLCKVIEANFSVFGKLTGYNFGCFKFKRNIDNIDVFGYELL